MDAALRAGVAVYNAGHYHAAHDAWEDRWLALESGTDDEVLLHGLIQFTAAVHHGYEGNWTGVRGLAASAGDYLDGLPPDYRGVDVAAVRRYLDRLAGDPEHVERAGPLALRYRGDLLRPGDLDAPGALAAAPVLADALDLEEAVIEAAVEYARADVAAGDTGSAFLGLVLDLVRDPDHRAIAVDRLRSQVSRRRSRETDVDDLFEDRSMAENDDDAG
ncbi:MAG: DUF309 domain-containing protein [Halobacteriaceae archaeon]